MAGHPDSAEVAQTATVTVEPGDVEIERGTLSRVQPDGRVEVIAETGGGPNGAALGPPPQLATTLISPFAATRVKVPRLISTRMMEPSGIAIGPSGN